MKHNKKDVSKLLDNGLTFTSQTDTCARCLERLDDDCKTYEDGKRRCKRCSVLIDHWISKGYAAFSL
jgi:hypothetical protein